MAFEAHWAPTARRDVKRLTDYLDRLDPDAAALVLGPVFENLESLDEAPYTGDIRRKIGSREFRETVAGNYRIFFILDPDEQTITIQHIRHVREQDPDFSE